jgi:6-phosphogluconate dehydrogenase
MPIGPEWSERAQKLLDKAKKEKENPNEKSISANQEEQTNYKILENPSTDKSLYYAKTIIGLVKDGKRSPRQIMNGLKAGDSLFEMLHVLKLLEGEGYLMRHRNGRYSVTERGYLLHEKL